MKVLKFGGTSVANPENIEKLIKIIKNNNERSIVIVSAFGGVTDGLVEAQNQAIQKVERYEKTVFQLKERHLSVIAQLNIENKNNFDSLVLYIEASFLEIKKLLDGCYLLGELSKKAQDTLLSFGELLSSKIIYTKMNDIFEKVAYKDSRELIKTDSNYGKAAVNFELSNYLIQYYFDKNQANLTFIPGFVAEDQQGVTTTLGRGGSDYTAAIIAAAIDASVLEIWTDVNGMYTANPKIVKQAYPIASISYKEAMELSHFGAKVLYAPTIQPVLNKEIPLRIKNTFQPDEEGTLVSKEPDATGNPIKGISHIENIALITLEGSGMVGVSGVSKRLFSAIASENSNVIFITQASSEHSICIGVMESDAKIVKQAIDLEFENEIKQFKIKPAMVETDLSIIALVGENMKSHQGLSGKMFSTLGNNNVNIRAIAQGASERNISAVIANQDVNKALNSLHEHFFEEQMKQLNLFIVGAGNVGAKLLEQIAQQKTFLKDNLKIKVRVVGISNSKKMYFDPKGIALDQWKETIEKGQASNLEVFIDTIKKINYHNSIFVDNTASAEVASRYKDCLAQNIAVVTCNKIACSASFQDYKELKNLARQYNAPFLFETNVGAGLPIIDTLKNVIASGDQVHKIQAVLSGSLNFIFNNYQKGVTFQDVVKQAQLEGYTEPDPKIDLSGIDVMRKMVILIRESGYEAELGDIENESFLTPANLDTNSVPEFLDSLLQDESHFVSWLQKAEEQGAKLKYVAQFENGKAKTGLQIIPKEHPFYHLEGKDNIVLFYTNRYSEQPLLIKGAGAGAAVTASGIFADIIRVGNTF